MYLLPERKDYVNITLEQRLSGPVLVTGGPQIGKTNVLLTFAVQDETSHKPRWIFDSGNVLFEKVLRYRASDDRALELAPKTILLDTTQSAYALMLPIENYCAGSPTEAAWVETLTNTINWAYTVHREAIPLPASRHPHTWLDLISAVASQLPKDFTQVRALFCPTDESRDKIFDDLVSPEALFMVRASQRVQGSVCSMLVGDRLITELAQRDDSMDTIHIYVDGFVQLLSPYFLKTVTREDPGKFTLILADSYENIALLKSLAPQIWHDLVQRTARAGGFIVHGAGSDTKHAEQIIRELAPYIFPAP